MSDWIELKRQDLRDPLRMAVELAVNLNARDAREGLADRTGLDTRPALLAAMQAVNVLLAAAAQGTCTRLTPAADIEIQTDVSDGRLIYRCRHKPNSHKWELDGTVIV
jgi:hypothetical protein